MSRVAILSLFGTLEIGIDVQLELWDRGKQKALFNANLAPNINLYPTYINWQTIYRSQEKRYRDRIKFSSSVTNINEEEEKENCLRLSQELEENLNLWLNTGNKKFINLVNQLNIYLEKHPQASLLIRSNNLQLQKLPWHLWHFLSNNPEVGLCSSQFINRKYFPKNRVRILAIFGDKTGLNLEQDKQIIQQLPGIEQENLCFIEEGSLDDIKKTLEDERGWDILFFAGHSHSNDNCSDGKLYIKQEEFVQINQLRSSLRRAIDNGLHLAIFNSCDGLGLANNLGGLGLEIPQIIFMREPIPDTIAHEFLKSFLQEFSQGKSLQKSVQHAKENLRNIENELPCASWLPVIYQHPTAKPWRWPQPWWKVVWKFLKKRKIIVYLSLGLLSAIVAIILISQPTACNFKLNDNISCGEEILDRQSMPWQKEEGVNNYAQKNYVDAVTDFRDSWKTQSKDPETLIYLNNALLEENKIEYVTLAVAVPLSLNTNINIHRPNVAREILRGVAQAQTEVNSCLIDSKILSKNCQNHLAIKRGIKIVIVDDGNDKQQAVKIAKNLSENPKIIGIIGHYASDITIETIKIYNKKELPIISPASTSTYLNNSENQSKFFFRVVGTTETEASILVDYLIERIQQKQATIFYNPRSPFTNSLAKEFKKQFEAKGGKIINIPETNLADENFNADQSLNDIKQRTKTALMVFPDGQVTKSFSNALELIKANNGVSWVLDSWGLQNYKLLEIANENIVKKIVVASPWHPLNSPNQEFPQEGEKLWHGTLNSRTALAYDAMQVFIEVLTKLDNPTRIEVQKALSAPIFQANGATGVIEFESNGNRKNPPQDILHILPCANAQPGYVFVPVKYSTSESAGLSCNNR